MPFALLIIGLFLLIGGVRNTQDQLFALVKGDFTGSDNFIFWLIAILLVGAVGYIPKLKPASTAFLILILLVLFLKKGNSSGVGGGFFEQFLSGIQGTQTASSNSSSTLPSLSSLQSAQAQNDANLSAIRQALASNIAAEQGLAGVGTNQ